MGREKDEYKEEGVTSERKPAMMVMERGRGAKKEQRAGSVCNGMDGEKE